MKKARVTESGIEDGDRGEAKYDVPAGYVDYCNAVVAGSGCSP